MRQNPIKSAGPSPSFLLGSKGLEKGPFHGERKDETLQEFGMGKLSVQGEWGQILGIFPSTQMNVADISLQ